VERLLQPLYRPRRAGWALGASGCAALSGDDITLDEVERTRI